MIRLFHGSNAAINSVDLSRGRPFKDFGQGFYLTDLKPQALLMAQRTSRIYGGQPVVTAFDFDLDTVRSDNLKIKRFTSADREWAMFVLANRNNEDPLRQMHDYDIVIGPVADDGVARQLRRYVMGQINADELVQELKFRELSSQFFFHTQISLHYLHKNE